MALAPEIIGSVVGAGSSLLNAGFNSLNIGAQTKASKELMDYQWKNYSSPQAQVRAMGAAGLNAGAILGSGKGSFAAPSPAMPSSSPVMLDGVANMANYLTAVANAKKAGVDTKNVEVDTQAKQFELELSKWFSAPAKVAEITLAWKNAVIKDDEHSINEFKKVSEKYISQLHGIERDSAQKVYENMGTLIELDNKQRSENIKLTLEKQKTEKSQQSANTASARASNAAADYTQSQKKYQDIVNDIKESGKTFELENLIRGYQAENKVNDATAEQALTMLARYRQLNDNNKNAAARYLNYMFWFIKEQMPNLPVVPYIKGN